MDSPKATLSAICAWIVTTSMPAFCADNDTQFKLNAQFTHHQSLSRNEVDSSAVAMTRPQTPDAASSQFSIMPPQGAPSMDVNPQGYISERNVDWRGWIAALADRWYYVLRLHENSSGLQYLTNGPALIQFTCFANGTIGNISLQQSSGNDAYDRLQMIALMQTAPLPPFPLGTRRSAISLCQGWESHVKRPGEQDFVPGSFGRSFPMEKVTEWVKPNPSTALSQRP
jgi:hypothetical protein